MTVNELIVQLDVLKRQGFGDLELKYSAKHFCELFPVLGVTHAAEDNCILLTLVKED